MRELPQWFRAHSAMRKGDLLERPHLPENREVLDFWTAMHEQRREARTTKWSEVFDSCVIHPQFADRHSFQRFKVGDACSGNLEQVQFEPLERRKVSHLGATIDFESRDIRTAEYLEVRDGLLAD